MIPIYSHFILLNIKLRDIDIESSLGLGLKHVIFKPKIPKKYSRGNMDNPD